MPFKEPHSIELFILLASIKSCYVSLVISRYINFTVFFNYLSLYLLGMYVSLDKQLLFLIYCEKRITYKLLPIVNGTLVELLEKVCLRVYGSHFRYYNVVIYNKIIYHVGSTYKA